MQIPAAALYGPNTARAATWLSVSQTTLRSFPELIAALGHVKVAGARANRALGVLDPELADAIVEAGLEVASGKLDEHFPIDIVQGGGGTATNINANEVIANRANLILAGSTGAEAAPINPADHVNRSQSSNDVYPTAVAIAALTTGPGAAGSLRGVERVLKRQADDAEGLERLGRTCLRDALPVPVPETLRAQALRVSQAAAQLDDALGALRPVPLGATAVGTGAGSPTGYRDEVVARLAEQTGLELTPVSDPFDALAHAEPVARVAAALRATARALTKIARDLRLLHSGPHGGIGELELPTVLIGSSIMPGKSNPVVPELVIQVGIDLVASAGAIEAAANAGELELNVMLPVATKHLLQSLRTIERVADVFCERCLEGITWDTTAVRQNLAGSYADAVRTAEADGYEAALAREDGA